MGIHACVCRHKCMNTRYAYKYTYCTHAHTHTHTHTYTYIHTHIHTHMHAYTHTPVHIPPTPTPRGATLEHLVNQLIEEPGVLWNHADIMTSRVGGFPHLHTPSEREITRFFLVTMRSFVDPLIFLRLLLHR